MSKRREIAASAYRAFFWNDRTHPPLEQFAKQLDSLVTDSTQAQGQNIRPQHHHRPHPPLGQRIPNSAGVAARPAQLKPTQSRTPNPARGHTTESRGDSL